MTVSLKAFVHTENEKSLFTGYMGSVQYVSENKETFIEVYSEFK